MVFVGVEHGDPTSPAHPSPQCPECLPCKRRRSCSSTTLVAEAVTGFLAKAAAQISMLASQSTLLR